ncbi:MAG: histidinol-phosphate transaminase [Clostridia bacterium]|nr:histidinol-phosphate transaminase [Clostridia bacterium]
MSYSLNEKMSALEPYKPVCGQYDIRLDANESFLDISENIRAEINKSVAGLKFNRYPDPSYSELYRAYAKFLGVSENLLTAGNGSDELISVITSAFLMKGEKLLTILPDFSMYSFYAFVSEDSVVTLTKDENFNIDIDAVIGRAKSEKVRMIIFSNPCNPTGKGFDREDVVKLISSVDALVVLDEAYMDFWDQSLIDRVEEFDNLIILKTFSKAFGMAALRLGFAISNEKLTGVLRTVKSPYNVNSVTQAAACAALKFPEDIKSAFDIIVKSKNELYSLLKGAEKDYPGRIEVIATKTNFVVVKTDEAKEIFDFLLAGSVAVRYMGAFLRITAGSKYENEQTVNLIKKYLEVHGK